LPVLFTVARDGESVENAGAMQEQCRSNCLGAVGALCQEYIMG